MSTATLPREARKLPVTPSVNYLRRSARPLQLADFPDREQALEVGRSLVYRQGRAVVVNDAPGDLFNLRADAGLI